MTEYIVLRLGDEADDERELWAESPFRGRFGAHRPADTMFAVCTHRLTDGRAGNKIRWTRQKEPNRMSTLVDNDIHNEAHGKPSSAWVTEKTWPTTLTASTHQRLKALATTAAFGTPEDPAEAGRHAVDRHAEDLRRLADS